MPHQPLITPATASDHVAIHRFLLSVFQSPTAAEFHAQLEHPQYEPTDRLLVRRGEQIVSHLRMQHRQLRFGPLWIPACYVSEVATLPEYRGRGCASALLEDAQRRMQQQGARIGMLRTSTPDFYQRRGWVACFRPSFVAADAREILSRLCHARAESRPDLLASEEAPAVPELSIRLWRHIEQGALMRLYDQHLQRAYGAWQRSPDEWRWLISRRGYDRIYVAIEGRDRQELDDECPAIVGYATMRERRIVELMTGDQRLDVAAHLLQRACGDVIEHSEHRVRLDTPPDHPLLRMLNLPAPQRLSEADTGDVCMVRVFKPLALLAQLCPLLLDRARVAGLSLPCELGLLLDDQKYQLALTRRSVRVVPGKVGRSYLRCSLGDLVRLMLGHVDLREAAENGSRESGPYGFSTSLAQELAQALFPRLPVWLPPWDDLGAGD